MKAMNSEKKMGKDSEKEHEEWEINSAVDTLLKAEEIKGNPALLKKVLARAAGKKKAIDSIAGLKAVKAELDMSPEEESDDEE